jgi:hypothetical protein
MQPDSAKSRPCSSPPKTFLICPFGRKIISRVFIPGYLKHLATKSDYDQELLDHGIQFLEF